MSREYREAQWIAKPGPNVFGEEHCSACGVERLDDSVPGRHVYPGEAGRFTRRMPPCKPPKAGGAGKGETTP